VVALGTFSGDLSTTNWTKTGYTVSGTLNEIATGTANTSGTNLLWAGTLSGVTSGDIADSTWSFKMAQIPTAGAPSVELRNTGGTVQWRLLRVSANSNWNCLQGATVVGTAIPDATLSGKFFRFRHVSTPTPTFYWETSPDGVTWTTANSTTTITSAPTALIPRHQISAASTGTWILSNFNGRGVSAAVAMNNSSNYHRAARERSYSY